MSIPLQVFVKQLPLVLPFIKTFVNQVFFPLQKRHTSKEENAEEAPNPAQSTDNQEAEMNGDNENGDEGEENGDTEENGDEGDEDEENGEQHADKATSPPPATPH